VRTLSGFRPLTKLLVAAAAALAALPAASASAHHQFGLPTPLPWLSGTYDVQLAQGAPGETIIAGKQPIDPSGNGDQQPVAAILGPHDLLPDPKPLDGKSFLGPSLAANGSGQAIAAFDGYDDSHCCARLRVVTREPGGDFGPGVNRTGPEGNVGLVDTAINERGDAVVVYTFTRWNNDVEFDAVFRPAGGEVSEPVQVAPPVPDAGAAYFDVTIDETGRATAAWYTIGDGDESRLHVASGDAATGFETPEVLDSRPAWLSAPHIGTDAAGNVLLTWLTGGSVDDRVTDVMAAARPRGGSTGVPHAIGHSTWSDQGRFERLDVAVSADGKALVSWLDGQEGWKHHVVATDTATSHFDPVPVPDGLLDWGYVATDAHGHAVLTGILDTWLANTLVGELVAQRGSTDGSFGDARIAACPPVLGAQTELVAQSGDSTAIIARVPQYIGVDYVLVRSLPDEDVAPPQCELPKVDPPPVDPPPVDPPPVDPPPVDPPPVDPPPVDLPPTGNPGGGDPPQYGDPFAPGDPPGYADPLGGDRAHGSTSAASEPPRVALIAPIKSSSRRLARLAVLVSTNGPGRLRVSGVLRTATGRRVDSFRPRGWKVRDVSARTIHLRVAHRRALRRAASATVRVTFVGAGGHRDHAVARVRVR
jgi:hypothetical protein